MKDFNEFLHDNLFNNKLFLTEFKGFLTDIKEALDNEVNKTCSSSKTCCQKHKCECHSSNEKIDNTESKTTTVTTDCPKFEKDSVTVSSNLGKGEIKVGDTKFGNDWRYIAEKPSVKDERCLVIKRQPNIPIDNFSVCVYNGYLDEGEVSYFSEYNVLEFDYSPNTHIISMIIEDRNNQDVRPLELLLEDMRGDDFEITVDLFDDKANLSRSFVFSGAEIKRFVTLEPFILGNNGSTLKYKVIFSYEEKQIF